MTFNIFTLLISIRWIISLKRIINQSIGLLERLLLLILITRNAWERREFRSKYRVNIRAGIKVSNSLFKF